MPRLAATRLKHFIGLTWKSSCQMLQQHVGKLIVPYVELIALDGMDMRFSCFPL
jgi:hypothetical protein